MDTKERKKKKELLKNSRSLSSFFLYDQWSDTGDMSLHIFFVLLKNPYERKVCFQNDHFFSLQPVIPGSD